MGTKVKNTSSLSDGAEHQSLSVYQLVMLFWAFCIHNKHMHWTATDLEGKPIVTQQKQWETWETIQQLANPVQCKLTSEAACPEGSMLRGGKMWEECFLSHLRSAHDSWWWFLHFSRPLKIALDLTVTWDFIATLVVKAATAQWKSSHIVELVQDIIVELLSRKSRDCTWF